MKVKELNKCNWLYYGDTDLWETSCGNCFCFSDGKPLEDGFCYCPYCGKEIEITETI
jgi:hypothetical protein